MRWFFLSTDTRRFIHQTTQKKDLFFLQESTKKKLQPIKFSLFPAGGTRDRTKEKKEKLFIKN
jgi:hypothetical protein